MMKDRKSAIVRSGRGYQKVSKCLTFIDIPFQISLKIEKDKHKPCIFVVGPPRSGSTLAYQVLHTGIHSFYLTNLWNLLYATPALGGIISRACCRNKISAFKSNRGFVSGLCGEAEGMGFWKHWMGQGLIENAKTINTNRLQRIASILSSLSKSDFPFISGYIGHSFSMDTLRKYFPGAVFVHITRSLVSNACSVYRVSPQQWFSLTTAELRGMNDKNRKRMISRQLVSIHRRILESSRRDDTFILRYEDLCNDPKGKVHELIEFVYLNKGFKLQSMTDHLPDRFDVSTNQDFPDRIEMEQYLQEENKRVGEHGDFFHNLLD